MNGFWEIKMSAVKPKTMEIYIYSDIRGDRTTWFGDTVKSKTSADAFREQLAQCTEADNIDIYINSLGGSVYEAVAIYNQLKRHKAKKTAYIDGFCCSAATLPAMACDTVVMPKNAVMFIHNAWVYTAGNASQLRKAADDLDVINGAMREVYLTRKTDALSSSELYGMMDKETYINAEDCIKYGFADKFADYDVDYEKAKKQLDESENDANASSPFVEKICAMLSGKPENPADTPESKPETQPVQNHEKAIETVTAMMTAYFSSLK